MSRAGKFVYKTQIKLANLQRENATFKTENSALKTKNAGIEKQLTSLRAAVEARAARPEKVYPDGLGWMLR